MANFSLTMPNELERYVVNQVETGEYPSVEDYVLSRLEAEKRLDEYSALELNAIRRFVQEGIDSGKAEGDVFQQLREEFDLPPSA